MAKHFLHWSRIHERPISVRFLGIILRVLRLEVSVNNVYTLQTTYSFKALLLGGGGGGHNPLVEMTVNSKKENSSDLSQLRDFLYFLVL